MLVRSLSTSKKLQAGAIPFAAGMLAAWLVSLGFDDLPLAVMAYFAGAAAACHFLMVMWGEGVARGMAALSDRPDTQVQQLALAAKHAHDSFLWHLKLGGLSVLVWLVVLATR